MYRKKRKKTHRSWTAEEQHTFIDTIEKYGKNYSVLEKMIPTRSMSNIHSYANNLL